MQNHSSSPLSAPNSAAPVNIDARRAQQLLERATALAGRGDLSAAILAARQSLALVPQNADGHAILGGLLERANNYGGASTAYEKSVQLAPDRAEFQQKLSDLRARLRQSQGAASQFQFDEDELYPGAESGDAPMPQVQRHRAASDGASGASPASTETASVDGGASPEVIVANIEARLPPSRAELENAIEAPAPVPVVNAPVPDVAPIQPQHKQAATVAAPGMVAAPVASAVAAQPHAVPLTPAVTPLDLTNADRYRQADRRQVSVPVAVERRKTPARHVSTAPIPAIAPVPLTLDVPTPLPVPAWKQVANRPSFYARTLPLVAAAVVGLGFLGWARGRAVSQMVAPVVSAEPVAPIEVAAAPNQIQSPPPVGQTAVVPNNNAASNNDSGFPISNVPVSPATTAPAVNANGNTNSAPTTPVRNTTTPNRPNRVAPRAVPRPVPVFPRVSLAPAPIPPASVRTQSTNNSGNSGSNVILPRPQIDLPAPSAPPVRVLPPSDTGLNPAGSPSRGYVRVTESRVGNGVIPAQPDAVARQNEQNASASARNGQTDQAISQLSQAINADADNAGFRYQQRASLWLQRGDYGRARDDFQSAIAAYQNQIARGDNVAAARRGLNSARSGLNVAMAELR